MRVGTDAFLLTRKVGQGDVEHVRGGVLNVGCYGLHDVPKQVKAAMWTAVHLGMQPRVHYDGDALSKDELDEIKQLLIGFTFATPSERCYWGFTEATFIESFRQVDIIIETDGPIDDTEQLVNCMHALWKNNGTRFVEGNHARESYEQLCDKYYQFGYPYEPFWQNLVNKTITDW